MNSLNSHKKNLTKTSDNTSKGFPLTVTVVLIANMGIFILSGIIYKSLDGLPKMHGVKIMDIITSKWLLNKGVAQEDLNFLWLIQGIELIALIMFLGAIALLHAYEINALRKKTKG